MVEIETELHAIVMERENLKIKNSGIEEKSQVRCVNLDVTFETQSLEIKEIQLQQEFLFFSTVGDHNFQKFVVGSMRTSSSLRQVYGISTNKRKKKDDVLHLSYVPP